MHVIAKNKKAYYEYFINETLEAGIVLTGDEVKSLREGKVSINESFAETENGELWLINANISSYKNSSKILISDEKRKRKLLVKKKDISTFQGKVEREGYTIIPIKIYFNTKGMAKIEIAVAKGKKLYDKREDKKQKDWNKQKQRLLRSFK
ncbi:MAG: SsrA-binding protein [Alphaproteobacteria bacterium MarineAlpha9_Bin4]|mgnify:FL=1|nr:SsrA-binding protein [Pelagibacterales bacterium]PPR26797.1 MAG: SsrA-binding protein [Alphaproteobacteria bacterium MarineAlpha9_Bin4]|tara:strand:+ start:3292 stop:3744 length:453 start_codon:yes stop_codon:yes gene_type:complete